MFFRSLTPISTATTSCRQLPSTKPGTRSRAVREVTPLRATGRQDISRPVRRAMAAPSIARQSLPGRPEPKTLRYRVWHAAGKLVRSGRRRRLKSPAGWPWAKAIATAWTPITALPHEP